MRRLLEPMKHFGQSDDTKYGWMAGIARSTDMTPLSAHKE